MCDTERKMLLEAMIRSSPLGQHLGPRSPVIAEAIEFICNGLRTCVPICEDRAAIEAQMAETEKNFATNMAMHKVRLEALRKRCRHPATEPVGDAARCVACGLAMEVHTSGYIGVL